MAGVEWAVGWDGGRRAEGRNKIASNDVYVSGGREGVSDDEMARRLRCNGPGKMLLLMYIIADAARGHYFSKYFASHLRPPIVRCASDRSRHGQVHSGKLIIRSASAGASPAAGGTGVAVFPAILTAARRRMPFFRIFRAFGGRPL